MSEGGRNFLVGAVSIIALLGLVLLLVLFGEADRFVQPRYSITILFNDAGGLVEGSAVTLNGVPVGVVSKVELARDKDFPVRVLAKINEHVQIPKPATAAVLVSLLGGRSTLLLHADFGQDVADFYGTDGQASIEGRYTPFAEEFSDTLHARMAPILNAFEEFRVFAETYSEVGRNINDLIKPIDPSDPDSTNIREAIARMTEALTQVTDAVSLAKHWLGDEQLRVDAREAVTGARELLGKASDTLDRFSTLAENLDVQSVEVGQKLVNVSDEISSLLVVVRGLAEKTNRGEGSLGMLISNPDLYNALNDAAVRLEHALREAQLLIQKLREEGVNIKL